MLFTALRSPAIRVISPQITTNRTCLRTMSSKTLFQAIKEDHEEVST